MQFRKAQRTDFDALVRLQNQNSIIVDATLDRADGVLASSFTAEDFASINCNIGIAICVEGEEERLLGFACCTTPEFNLKAGLPSAMISRFDQAKLEGKPLSQWKIAICGPVCVEKPSRGLGIFERLYGQLWQLIPPQYEVAVALVSTSNTRSLAAHKKLGMAEVDQFSFNDKTYDTIAIKIEPRSHWKRPV